MHDGHIPISDLRLTKLVLLSGKNYIKRNKEEKVFIEKAGCAYNSLDIYINDGNITPTDIPGIYSILTSTKKDTIVVSIKVFNYDHSAAFVDDFAKKVK